MSLFQEVNFNFQIYLDSIFPMTKLSCVPNYLCSDIFEFRILYIQTFERSELSMSRLSCGQKWVYSEFPVFRVVYVQTLLSSQLFRISRVQNSLFLEFYELSNVSTKNFMRSELFMSRFSCVQKCLYSDFLVFRIAYIQTFMR